MSDNQTYNNIYVGPKDPPAARRPPASEVGVIGWLRANLFKSLGDTISTILTLTIVTVFVVDTVSWALVSAQWEVIFLNLRQLGSGPEFPSSEVWRIELSSYIAFFLVFMSVGFWGRIPRWAMGLLVLIGVAIVVIPEVSVVVEEPTLHYFVASDYDVRQVAFIAEEGDEITFSFDPLTEDADFGVGSFAGYIANDNQLSDTSWDAFNSVSRDVDRGLLPLRLSDITALTESRVFALPDRPIYDLNVSVAIYNAAGELIQQSEFTNGSADNLVSMTWEAPEKGWYSFAPVFDEDNIGSTGIAWLKVDDLEVFFSTVPETEKRVEEFGEPPELDCRSCATSTNRTDLRFNGERTVPQWFSLQLAPYLTAISTFFFVTLAVSSAGYGMGQVAKYRGNRKWMTRSLVFLWVLSLPIQYVIVIGFENIDDLPIIDTADLGGLFLTIVLSAIGIIASFPVGIMLALGRQSDLPVIKFLCTLFIEVVRGVPLITLLFFGLYILLFVVDGARDVDRVIRMGIVLTLFTAAYLAEVIRGGLQIIPKGQIEAAKALGLNGFYTTVFIVLPQALRAVIPAIMGQFVSLLKDTSLVALFGVFELLGATRRILTDTATGYAALQREGYIYIGIIYFILCYLLAVASRRLETTGAGAVRRERI